MKFVKYFLIIGAIMFLIGASLNVSATTETDPTDDVRHWTGTGTSFSWEAYTGDKPNIDITSVGYSISGSEATLTMTVDGTITSSTTVFYYMHLTSSAGTYQAYYAAGVGMWVGTDEYLGETGMLTNPVSDNTFTATFTISDPTADYDVWGYAQEITDIYNYMSAEYWADYAPASSAPWYVTGDDDTGDDDTGDDDTGDDDTGDDDTGDDDTGGDDTGDDTGDNDNGGTTTLSNDDGDDGKGTPGFEAISIIAALAIAFIVLRKKRN